MKLEIESQEELEAAMKAVSELRRITVRHVGKHARRMSVPCEQSKRERVFSEEWAKVNERHFGLNGGFGTLEILLCTDDRNHLTRDLTPEEASAAATVLQWFGTNCGWPFIVGCIEKSGYIVSRAKDRDK